MLWTSLAASVLVVLALALLSLHLARRPIVIREREAEAQLEILWQAMGAHAMMNVSEPDGRVLYVNDTFVAASGYTREELIGKKLSKLMIVDGAPSELLFRTLATQGSWGGETKLRRKDGSLFWTRSTVVALRDRRGRILRTVSLRTDITESKLRQAEAQHRALLDRLRDEVYVFDSRDMTLCYLNRSARERLGRSEAELRQQRMTEIVTGFDETEFADRAAPLLSGEAQAITFESSYFGQPVEISLQLDDFFDGRQRFVAVLRDISLRKRAEAERAEFVATVSHELRAPLTSVMGALKLVTGGASGELAAKPRALLDVALRNVDRAVLLINDLLDLEKLDAGKMEMPLQPTDLAALVDEALAANAGYGAEFGVRFAGDACRGPMIVAANRDRLIQVLNNLLSNAAKFSHPGGVVEVALRDTGNGARILVQDHGLGIPKEAQGKLFERFAQAGGRSDLQRRGSGLGLSIARAIVERHGGTIGFDSEEGVGTTFRIDLPKERQDLYGAA